jgi:hypothetical protein
MLFIYVLVIQCQIFQWNTEKLAIAETLNLAHPIAYGCEAAARVCVRAEDVEFMVDKVALGQVFSEYFGFPCQSSFHQFLFHRNHPGLAQYAYGWLQCRVDPVGLQPPVFELKKIYGCESLDLTAFNFIELPRIIFYRRKAGECMGG